MKAILSLLRTVQNYTLDLKGGFFSYIQAASHLEEYNEMLEFILKWCEKANILVHGSITWNSSSQLRDQFKAYQVII